LPECALEPAGILVYTTVVIEQRASRDENRPHGEIVLDTIAAPGLARDVTTRVAEELAEDLARSYSAVGWRTVLEVDRLVEPPALVNSPDARSGNARGAWVLRLCSGGPCA
jgi:hypothetical protein